MKFLHFKSEAKDSIIYCTIKLMYCPYRTISGPGAYQTPLVGLRLIVWLYFCT